MKVIDDNNRKILSTSSKNLILISPRFANSKENNFKQNFKHSLKKIERKISNNSSNNLYDLLTVQKESVELDCKLNSLDEKKKKNQGYSLSKEKNHNSMNHLKDKSFKDVIIEKNKKTDMTRLIDRVEFINVFEKNIDFSDPDSEIKDQ